MKAHAMTKNETVSDSTPKRAGRNRRAAAFEVPAVSTVPASKLTAPAKEANPSKPLSAEERFKRSPRRGSAAGKVLWADRLEAECAYWGNGSAFAPDTRAAGLAPMPPELVVLGPGGELVPTNNGDNGGMTEARLINTLEQP